MCVSESPRKLKAVDLIETTWANLDHVPRTGYIDRVLDHTKITAAVFLDGPSGGMRGDSRAQQYYPYPPVEGDHAILRSAAYQLHALFSSSAL
jgi:hypothetical protein